jgi:hypothetical protein
MSGKNIDENMVLSMGNKEFAIWYNKNLPERFPRVTVKLLQLFKKKHMGMFRKSYEWQIDRHRKHLINWLFIRQYEKDYN